MFWRTKSIISVSSIMAFLASLAVTLRFLARYIKKVPFEADDYLVVIGLILSLGICVCNIVGGAIGRFGAHEIDENGYPIARLLIVYGKLFYVLKLLHTCAMPILKMSLLWFFRRIFGHNRKFRIFFWILATYISLWWFVIFWLTVFQCWPLSYNWATHESAKAGCIPNYHKLYSYSALTNVFSDVAIVILPLPFVWTLNMSLEKRLASIAIFLTAAIVIVASIGRTVSYFTVGHTFDYTYQNYYYLIWSSVEPCIGCVGCCLPTFRPLFALTPDSGLVNYVRGLFSTRSDLLQVESQEDVKSSLGQSDPLARRSNKSSSARRKFSSEEAIEFSDAPVHHVNGEYLQNPSNFSGDRNDLNIFSGIYAPEHNLPTVRGRI